MKRWLASVVLCPLFFCSGSVCEEDITFPGCSMSRGPIDITVAGDAFQAAKGNDDDLPKGSTLQFGQVLAEVRPVIFASERRTDFVGLILGYSNTLLKWKKPVQFTEDHFQIAHIGFAGMSKRFTDWTFLAYVQGNFNVNRSPKNHYTTFDIFFDSRFEICKHWGLHGGVYAETGMKMDRVWPVIGFDWEISPTWQLNAVFPYDMALIWKYSQCWTFFLREHCFSFRSRLGNDPLNKEGLVRYETAGTELGFIYASGTFLAFDVHAGYSSSGLLRVANKNNQHSHRYDFDGVPYVGGKASVNF